MLKVMGSYIMESNAQNSPGQSSTVCELSVNFQMFKLDLEKAEEPEIKLPTSAGSLTKQELQKNIYFCFIDYAKVFDYVDNNKLENSERDGNEDQTTWPASWEICMQVRKQQLELDMEQQAGSK